VRYLRLVIGSLVIIGALYVLVAEHVTGASSNAFVNSPLITVRAPVAGDIEMPSRTVGAQVSTDTVLFNVTDVRADSVRLDDLTLEHERALAEIDRLEAQKVALEGHRDRLEDWRAAYAAARTDELAFQAGASTDATVSDLTDPEKLEDLAIDLPVSDAPEDTPQDGTSALSTLTALQLEAAKGNVFLDDSAGAAWNYAYWAETARHQLARLDSELEAARSAATSIDDRIARERVRMIRLTGGDITSPADGIIWERMVGDGVNVQRGDPIMRIADCSSVVVSLSVSEIVYNRLRTGDPAIFRMSGTDTVMEGTIARLAGAGAASVYDDMAVKPSNQHLERYDVTLIVPELRDADLSGGCGIGRTGRVFFAERPLDPLRRLLN
jgi:multidrug resistance efflux pump